MAVLGLIALAFGMRVFFVERLPYDYDRSYAHGVGMTILRQLGNGLPPAALLHSESSNSGLTNPILTNYVFALIGLLDRSPYSATIFTAALGALIAALTYDLGRRVFGWRGRRATRWLYFGAVLLLLSYAGSRFVLEVVLQRPLPS